MKKSYNHRPAGWSKLGGSIYSDEDLKYAAEKYKGRLLKDFRNENLNLYQAAGYRGPYINGKNTRGFLHNLTKDMIYGHSIPLMFTDDELKNIALLYKTRKEFEKGNQPAYKAAIYRGPIINSNGDIVKPKSRARLKKIGYENTFGFLNEICKHMSPQGNLYKRLIYVFKFYNENGEKNAAYVGLSCNPDKRKKQHLQRITYKSSVGRFIEKNPTLRYEYETLTDFVSIDIAKKLEDEYIHRFKNDGWLILNVAKAGVLGSSKETPEDELRKIAAKYSDLPSFLINDINTYKTICRRGLTEKLTSHIVRTGNPKKYTDEDLINAAIECGSYQVFRKQYDKSKWQQAYRRNLLPKIKEILGVESVTP